MTHSRRTLALVALPILASACGGGPTNPNPNPGTLPTPSVACSSVAPTQLSVGQHLIIDPAATSGCLRLAAPDASGAQYLVVLTSTSGVRSTSGISGP
ncbi:MAG TPA: hypothetical protein VFU23_07560, partial [Gemmatimonadales bacterium]|nr:hypothetical protein [Gemmatimonadales bacterium]